MKNKNKDIAWYKVIEFQKGDEFEMEMNKKYFCENILDIKRMKERKIKYREKAEIRRDFLGIAGSKLLDVLFKDNRFPPYLVLGDNGKKLHTKVGVVRFEFYCKKKECGVWDDVNKKLVALKAKTGRKKSVVQVIWDKEEIEDVLKGDIDCDDIDDEATINMTVSFPGRNCLHFGVYDKDKDLIICHPEYWRADGVTFGVGDKDRLSLFIEKWGLLRDDMKLCGNYRNIPDFYRYYNDKRKNKNICFDKDLYDSLMCMQSKCNVDSIKEVIQILNVMKCEIDVKWYKDAVNKKDINDPKRKQVLISINSICGRK